MSGDVFEARWLAKREPVDHQSRPEALLALLVVAWRRRGWSRVLDLASGTGSNLRYLAPHLPAGQVWTLVDHDAGLLARAARLAPVHDLHRVCGNLADAGMSAVGQAHLVTGSAFLDLVSEAWLRAMVAACRSADCGVLFALSYDGFVEWRANDAPSDPTDALVLEAVNAHQRRDKGLGPALGPTAGSVAASMFQDVGYRTWLLPSPWHLGPSHSALARLLVEGWETAAVEEAPRQADLIRAWARRRLRLVAEGTFALMIGHVDLLAIPAESV